MLLSRLAHRTCRPRNITAFAGVRHLQWTTCRATETVTGAVSTASTAPSQSASPTPTPTPQPPPSALRGPLSNLPRSWHPYILLTRLDKPTGTWLLFLPCSWSIAMAAHHLALPPEVAIKYTLLFGAGAMIMRGAGCTVNDMWDRRLDRLVERTKIRPLASGALTLPQATIFLGFQLLGGLGVLVQLNPYSIGLGASSLLLVATYPFFKRVTYWPQAVLGLTFNWGALLGYAALSAPPAWEVVLPLYAGAWCWTLVYDTIYAHQDKEDDLPARIRSTALLFGSYTPPILTAFSLSFLSLLAVSGHFAGLSLPFYIVSVGGAGVGLARIIATTKWDNRESCWRGFKGNVWIGGLVAAGIWGDYLWSQRWKEVEPKKEETSAPA